MISGMTAILVSEYTKLFKGSYLPGNLCMKSSGLFAAIAICFSFHRAPEKTIVVWQPSHQTNTGVNFSEAAVSNAIAEAAMQSAPHFREYKVWSFGRKDVHDADSGSNTMVAHTSAVIDGRISGYAWELKQANKHHPDVFIALHNNGGTRRHAVWGYIHYGDPEEQDNRSLATALAQSVAAASGLEYRGVLLDSTTGRNDYRCATTGKLAFYSLDEHVNTAPFRVLLEIGDNGVDHDFLQNPVNQQKIGAAVKQALAGWLAEHRYK
jgi:hypothetical protein